MEERERTEPRISVTKLGEYMVAPPARRRRIIADQKRPRNFIVPRYGAAEEAIVDFLSQDQDEREILKHVNRLGNASGGTDWQNQTSHLCSEALECFLDAVELLDLDGLQLVAAPQSAQHLKIAGVSISARPEVLLGRQDGTRGVLKIYFGKTVPLSDEAGAFVGTCLREFASSTLGGARIDHRLCLVLDVFAGRLFEAPRAHKRRMRDIEAACEEIRRAWHAL